MGKLHQAVEDFGRAIGLDPTNSEYRRSRALVYKSLGEFDTASEDYDTAISLQPANASAGYTLDTPILHGP